MQDKLTISQGLRYAAKLKNQVAELRQRALASVTYEAGQPTAFDFDEVFGASQQVCFDLATLKARIAETNANIAISFKSNLTARDKTISLAEAITYLQEIKGMIAWIKSLPTQAAERISRSEKVFDYELDKYVSKTVETVCRLPEAARASTLETFQDEFDLVNGLVESKNQTTFLV